MPGKTVSSAEAHETSRQYHHNVLQARESEIVSLKRSVEDFLDTVFHNAYKRDAEGKLQGRKKAFLVEVRSDRYKGLGWYAGWEWVHPGLPVVNVQLGHTYIRQYPAHAVFPAAPGTKVPYELARIVLPNRRLATPVKPLP